MIGECNVHGSLPLCEDLGDTPVVDVGRGEIGDTRVPVFVVV